MKGLKLIEYLPVYMRNYPQISHAMTAQQDQLDKIYSALETALNNNYIMWADEDSVCRYEKILGIKPLASHSLMERKLNILVKLTSQLPFTIHRLKESLYSICGEKNCQVILKPNIYFITIRLELKAHIYFNAVMDLLKLMLPANMNYEIILVYNSHRILSRFKHSDMRVKNHSLLRNEVYEN